MKKIIISIAVILLIIILGIFFWRADQTNNNTPPPSPTSTIPNTTVNFQVDGILVRNNPGLVPNVWHIVTEQPGTPAVVYMLQFNSTSDCTINREKTDCTTLSIDNGMRVHVTGNKTDTTIHVATLETVNPIAHIRVTTPQPNDSVTSPIIITGEATGNWYFEASFPITLKDTNGKILVQTHAQAKGDWMTEQYVPFTVSLPFSVTTTTSATIVFEKDNPSGLPEHDQQFSIPITLLPKTIATKTVTLYYYNPEKDKDITNNIMCTKQGLVGVKRSISVTNTPIQDTIKLLLQGNLTDAERAQGITTEYPLTGFTLTGASQKNGNLTLSFADPNNKTGGGSCRVGILWSQISETAKQFPGVTTVTFTPEELFQP